MWEVFTILKSIKSIRYGVIIAIISITTIATLTYYHFKVKELNNKLILCQENYKILESNSANLQQALINQNNEVLKNKNDNNIKELNKQIQQLKEQTEQQIKNKNFKIKTCNDVLRSYYNMWNKTL